MKNFMLLLSMIYLTSANIIADEQFRPSQQKFIRISDQSESTNSLLRAETTELLNESFENYQGDWILINSNQDTVQWGLYSGTNAPHSGVVGAGIYYSSAGNDDYLISPQVSLPVGKTIELSFWARSHDAGYLESFNVRLSTSEATVAGLSIILENVSAAPAEWTKYSYDLSEYAGQNIYFALHNTSVNKWYQWADDFLVTATDQGSSVVADFTATVTSGTAPLAVSFSDLSSGNPTSWSWDFGDGGSSSLQNPTHSYSSAGSYTVSFTATNSLGSDTKTKTGYISVTNGGSVSAGMDLSYWGWRHSSRVNQNVRTTYIEDYQFSSEGEHIYHAYRAGVGEEEGDKKIRVTVSHDMGNSWTEKEISPSNHGTDRPRIISSPTATFVMYNYTDLTDNYVACIARTLDHGLTFNSISIDDTHLSNIINDYSDFFSYATESGNVYIGSDSYFFRSTDNGLNFTEVEYPSEFKTTHFQLAYDENTIWATYRYSDSIFVHKSTDGGTSFTKMATTFQGTSSEPSISTYDGKLAMIWQYEELGSYKLVYQLIDGLPGQSPPVTIYTSSTTIKTPLLKETESYLWAYDNNSVKEKIWRFNIDGTVLGKPANIKTELNLGYFYLTKMHIVNDTTYLGLRDSIDGALKQTRLHNLRWVDFPYSESYLDTFIDSDNFALTWNSYVDTEKYKFQFSNDHFSTFLIDTVLSSESIYFPMRDIYAGERTTYYYRLCGYDESTGFQTSWTPTLSFIYHPEVGLDDKDELPSQFSLSQNYPNPFNPTTLIDFTLPQSSDVRVTVFDIQGREIARLAEFPNAPGGKYSVRWNGFDANGVTVGAGVYLARIEAGDFTKSIKMLLLK